MRLFQRLTLLLVGLAVLLAAFAGLAAMVFSFGVGPKLGLDLQGGTHLVLKIEREDISRDRLERTVADVRTRLRGASIRYTGLTGTGQTVSVAVTDPAQMDAAYEALRPLAADEALALSRGNDGTFTIDIADRVIDADVQAARSAAIDVVARRIAETGSRDFRLRQDGPDRVDVQIYGALDVERLKPVLTTPARFELRLLDETMTGQEALAGRWPAGSEILYSLDDPPVPYLVERAVIADSRDLAAVDSHYDASSGDGFLSFRLTDAGREKLATASRAAVGRRLVMLFDDQVMDVVPIAAPIADGTGRVAANFSETGVEDAARMLRAGALPASLTPVEERSVSTQLASGSFRGGALAIGAAAILVLGLMVLLYRVLGLISALSLALVLLVALCGLALLGVPLTLPGLAALALIVGIAVDANVLVFERLREEERQGRPPAEAASSGFARSAGTILASSMTLFAASLILLLLGNETIAGFAATLCAGIVASIAVTFTVTRWLVMRLAAWTRPHRLSPGRRHALFEDPAIRFMGLRRYSLVGSGLLSVAALLLVLGFGIDLGSDFGGGASVELRPRQGDLALADINQSLSELNIGAAQAMAHGRDSAVIRVPEQDGGENADQSAMTMVRNEFADAYDFLRVEVVGPAVSGELVRSASLCLLAAISAVGVSIFLRFGWRFAVGALIATLHDILLVLGFFAITRLEFNLSTLAALLTVIGYSLNDTIVVYDRMRDNLKRFPRMPLPILIDASINSTLSRTLLTSGTTALALIAVMLFGGEVIRPFAGVMLFGVVIATFSSIYIAAPVLILFRLRPGASDENDETTGPSAPSSGAPAL